MQRPCKGSGTAGGFAAAEDGGGSARSDRGCRARATLRDWTLRESLLVRDLAPFEPVGEIARMLGRHPADVYIEAARLMLKRPRPKRRLLWCSRCCAWRTGLDRNGECPVCRERSIAQRNEARIAALLAKLPPEEVATYARTDAIRQSRAADPRPKAPDTGGMPRAEAVEARIAYEAAMEEWERMRIFRVRKANQKRIERIRRKVDALGEGTEVLHRRRGPTT